MVDVNIKQLSKPKESTYPSVFADPSVKQSREYCLMSAKAVYWDNWKRYEAPVGDFSRNRIIDNRLWANGQFDVSAFTGGKGDINRPEKTPFLKNLDFDPVTVMPKLQDIVVGYLEQLDFSITATAINPAAKAKREDERIKAIATLRQQEFAKQVNEAAGVKIMDDSGGQFNSEEEINIYFQLGGYKQIEELGIEIGNKIVLNESDWPSIKKKLCKNAFTDGRMAIDTEVNNKGRIKYKYVDPVNCGVEPFFGEYLHRPGRIYYIEAMTVAQILLDSQNCGQPLTEAECKAIAQQFENQWGNPAWNNSNQNTAPYVNTDNPLGYFWYSWYVPVLKCYWEELDIYNTVVQTKGGKELRKPAAFNAKNEVYYDVSKGGRSPRKDETYDQSNPDFAPIVERNVKPLKIHGYYQAKWIVGTEFIWDYGKVPFQVQDPFEPTRALCPLKYYRVANQPLAERIKPWAKKVYEASLKFDREIANSKPAGWEINVAALENISLGQGKTFTVTNAIELWNESGSLIYRDESIADEFGKTKNKTPIRAIDQSVIMQAMERWIATINFCNRQIIDVTGINEFMDATSPNKETPVGIAQVAQESSKNSMSQMLSGILAIAKYGALDVSERLKAVVKRFGEYSGYADSMGIGLLEFYSVGQDVATNTYGIEVVAKPNSEQKRRMKDVIQQSFQSMASPEQGGLWAEDMLEFEDMVDKNVPMKLIRIMMSARQKMKMQKLQQQKDSSIQLQAQANKEMQQEAAQLEMQKEQQLSQIRMSESDHLTDNAIRLEQAKSSFRTQNQNDVSDKKTSNDIQKKMVENVITE